MVRACLRLAARFLRAIKEINKDISDLKSVFNPQFYDDFMEAINVVGKYDNEKDVYETPANFVEEKRNCAYNNLKASYSDDCRDELAKTTLITLLILNRRRPVR